MMYTLGKILGWTIVTGYTLTMLNFVVKRVNRAYIMKLPKDSAWRSGYQRFMHVIVANHRIFAFVTAAALLAHFIIQYLSWGFFISGLVAGGLLLTQVSLGVYGTYACGRKNGPWLLAHRTVSVLLLAAIAAHILIIHFFYS